MSVSVTVDYAIVAPSIQAFYEENIGRFLPPDSDIVLRWLLSDTEHIRHPEDPRPSRTMSVYVQTVKGGVDFLRAVDEARSPQLADFIRTMMDEFEILEPWHPSEDRAALFSAV